LHNYSSLEHDSEKTQGTLITDDHVYSVSYAKTAERQKAYQELIINEVFTRSHIKNAWETTKQRYRKTRKS